MITSRRTLLLALVLSSTVWLPHAAHAATLYLDSDQSSFHVGDTALIRVRIDTEGQVINAVEGALALDHAAEAVSLRDINTAGSRFSLWPGKPLPSERNTRITFTGGSPDGINARDANILSIVLELRAAGTVSLTPQTIAAYVHDGKGTADVVRSRDLVIEVLPAAADSPGTDAWRTIVESDVTPPEPFEIQLGQDRSTFDGKKFISFNTTDGQSGISHYEVSEQGLPPVHSANTYVLREQDAPVSVTVTAYDAAGNMRESTYHPATARQTSYAAIGVFVGVLLLLLVVLVRRRRRRSKRT